MACHAQDTGIVEQELADHRLCVLVHSKLQIPVKRWSSECQESLEISLWLLAV